MERLLQSFHFFYLTLYLRIVRSPDISADCACRIVALSHRDRGGYSICYYVKNTGKYHKVQESTGNYRKTGKSGKRFCRTVAFFSSRRFQFSETQNASDIISFYPSLNKSAYIRENRKAVNTLFNVSTAFFMRFFYFKNTHIHLVEARGIEPLSEAISMQLSTSVSYLL